MNTGGFKTLFGSTLRSPGPRPEQFERLAEALLEACSSGDTVLRRHIQNRLEQIVKRTGGEFSADRFDLDTARLVIADETGFAGWDDLITRISDDPENDKPLLFQYAAAAMQRGDFTALEDTLGGPEHFTGTVIEWFENGYFEDEAQTLAEVFSAACMLGHAPAAGYLLDKGVDPLAGIKTGLNGFHYAASSGRAEVVNLLIERGVPTEVRNMYGGTVMGQALWSAVNEHKDSHAEIIEALIGAGAYLEPGTLKWWNEQDVPGVETRRRVAAALRSREAG